MDSEIFDITNLDEEIDSAPITLWIPLKHKEKYDRIQEVSRKRFSKFLKKIILESIDGVKLEA